MKKQCLFFVSLCLCGVMFLFGLESCKDDPKPDLCKSKTPTSARFTIGEQINNKTSGNGFPGIIKVDTVIVSDTVLNEQQIVFEAQDENDSYEWKVGEDPKVLTGKKVSLWFASTSGNFPLPSTFSVRLITKKRIDKICFPTDDGVDTVTHQFTIIERARNPLIGNYEGYLKSNPSDIFTIKITYVQQVVDSNGEVYNPDPAFSVANLLKGCNDNIWWWAACRMSFGYRSMNFANTDQISVDNCKRISGWIFVEKNGNVQVPFYKISDTIGDTKLVKDVFYGKLKK